MKLNLDTKKGAEAMSNLLHKTSDAGKKAAESIQKGAMVISEKAKNDSYLRKLKKLNPLFPDVYQSESFNLPNMIVIVDDAVRRGIDVCEGAIGWLSSDHGMEVLHLYDEAVELSGIQFIPAPDCDAVYYVDSFDRNVFVRIDQIFSRAHTERLAELKHIAHSLGAKSCSIEICESSSTSNMGKKKISIGGKVNIARTSESIEQQVSSHSSSQRSGRIFVEFEGSNAPQYPSLKWFAHDNNIKNLIEMRCSGTNSIKSETLELSGASSAAMSQKTASAIDNTIGKFGIKGSAAMESQANKESMSKLIYIINF